MSEKISCGIAQDLMPLVIDDACGEESRQAVESHIAECAECAKVYEAMKAEMPKPAADENADAHFRQSMKKTRRKTRWVKIACGILATILLIVIGYFAVNPKPLFAEKTTAPVSWIHDAHLVRTEAGNLALRFTPDERYKMYMGSFPSITDLTDGFRLDISFNYSKMAKMLNVRPVTDEAEAWNQFMAEFLYNGDLVIPLYAFGTDLYYTDGKIRLANFQELTEEKRQEMNLPEAVGGRPYWIYDFEPENNYGGRIEVVISDGTETLTVYDGNQEITLCDPEEEKLISKMVYHEIGEIGTSIGP